MTKISKIPVEPKKMDRFYDDFWNAISLLESKEDAKNFLFDLLTHTERKMLAKRLQIAMMLLERYDYRSIKERLKVSEVTIAKINNWLNTGADGLAKIAKKLIDSKTAKSKKPTGKKGGYLAGDLLMPAIETGLDIAARRFKKGRE